MKEIEECKNKSPKVNAGFIESQLASNAPASNHVFRCLVGMIERGDKLSSEQAANDDDSDNFLSELAESKEEKKKKRSKKS